MAIRQLQRFFHKVEPEADTIPTSQAALIRPTKRSSNLHAEEMRHLTRAVKTSSRQQAQLIAAVERFLSQQGKEPLSGERVTSPTNATVPQAHPIQAELSPLALSTIDKMTSAVRSGHVLQKDQAKVLRNVHHDMRETLTALQKFSADLTQAHRQQVETSTALLAQSREALKSQQFQITELRRQQEQACFLLEQHHEARLRRNDRHHRIQTRILAIGSLVMGALLVACVLMLMHTASRISAAPQTSSPESSATAPVAEPDLDHSVDQFPQTKKE